MTKRGSRKGVSENVTEQLRAAVLANEEKELRASLARRSGVSHSTITRFVDEGKQPILSTVEKLCRALNLKLTPDEEE